MEQSIVPAAKYIKVIERLKEEIATGKLSPGDKIQSIREICSSCGVSSTVALRVFRELAEQGLVEKHDGEGYYVLPAGGANRADKIVCAFRPLRDYSTSDNFGSRVIYGIMNAALSNHRHIVFPESCMRLRGRIPSDDDVKILADEVFSFSDIAGIILDMRIPDELIRRYFLPRAGRVPLVVAGRMAKPPVKSSFVPMAEIGQEMSTLVKRSGAVSCLLFQMNVSAFPDVGVLMTAFSETVGFGKENLWNCGDLTAVGMERDNEIADSAAKRIQANRGKTFVFCGTDAIAAYFCQLMSERGFEVRRDYMLMGFGGFEIAESSSPKLGTVAVDQSAIGSNAVELALGGPMRTSIPVPYSIKFNETF